MGRAGKGLATGHRCGEFVLAVCNLRKGGSRSCRIHTFGRLKVA